MTWPPAFRIRPKYEASQFRPTRSYETGDPENLAAPQCERAAVNAAAVADVANLEKRSIVGAWTPPALPLVEAGEIAPHHHPDDAFVGDVRSLDGAGDRAVSQNGDPVGESGNLGHSVADVYDGETSAPQPLDQSKKTLRLHQRKRRRRLVHHQNSDVSVDRARDLDELALREG